METRGLSRKVSSQGESMENHDDSVTDVFLRQATSLLVQVLRSDWILGEAATAG